MMDTRDSNSSVVADKSVHHSSIGSKIKKHWILSSVIAVTVVLLCLLLLVRARFPSPKPSLPVRQPIPVAVTPVKLGDIDVLRHRTPSAPSLPCTP